MLKDALHAPEAAAREDGGFRCGPLRRGFVDSGAGTARPSSAEDCETANRAPTDKSTAASASDVASFEEILLGVVMMNSKLSER